MFSQCPHCSRFFRDELNHVANCPKKPAPKPELPEKWRPKPWQRFDRKCAAIAKRFGSGVGTPSMFGA